MICLTKSQLMLAASVAMLAACSPKSGQLSDVEQQTLKSTALSSTSSFNMHDAVGDVQSSLDAVPASEPFHVNDIAQAIEVPVRDCTTPGLYEMERLQVLNEAKQDVTGQTVPVKFAYSFGRKHDELAYHANQRAVLSASNQGISYIPVGSKTGNSYNGKSFYYKVDNREVARQYRTGERCFFSTIKVDPAQSRLATGYYDFIKSSLLHQVHYMYYGYCQPGKCHKTNAFAGEYSNRLFKEVPSLDNGEPQIIKLYMADLRSEQLQHDVVVLKEDTVRGVEIDSSIRNILNVCEIHKNYHDVTKNVSLDKNVNGYDFSAINGAVQMINNILSHDVDGTMLSSQYTPIVIDLKGDGVKTSSVRWGTYFNMAALEDVDGQGQSHRTAWLGGSYVDVNQGGVDPRVNMDVRLINDEDAFLVVPNAEGKVTSSTQLFGDRMVVGGKTYENGFLALQAFAGKNCSSEEPEDRYLGHWDGDLYDNKLKLWIDKNRNGVSDNGEIISLRDAGVVAINACHIVHANEEDSFGNKTHLRSAVLMKGNDNNLMRDKNLAFHYLQFGRGYDGEKGQFNLAIDLIFQVNEEDRCPGASRHVENYAGVVLPPTVPIGTTTPSTPEPPTNPDPVIPDNF